MRTVYLSLLALAGIVCVFATSPVSAAVCDPSTLETNEFICYQDGGFDSVSNRVSGTYAPTQPFVQGSQICVAYDVSAEIEEGGYDRVFLRFQDNLGGQDDTCLAGISEGDCGEPAIVGGCLDFPAVTYELDGTVCYSPTTGASNVTVSVYVAPVDVAFQCGDNCDAGGDLGVTVNSLGVTGCTGFEAPTGCGDGNATGGEQCDDGNEVAQDGCSNTCQIEAGGICNADATDCAGQNTCGAVTPSSLAGSYCYTNTAGLAESTLSYDWQIRADGSPMHLYWEVQGGVELFKNGEYDSLWMTWSDNAGGGETFFINDGGLFQSAFYETWSKAGYAITPNTGATDLNVTFWVQADSATSCAQPKAGAGPNRPLFVDALTLSSCDVTAQQYDTQAEFTQALGGCFIVHDFNSLNANQIGPFSGDGYMAAVDTNQPGVALTAAVAPYRTTQASGDGSVALEAQGFGNYESNSRLRVTFQPGPARAFAMNIIDAGDGNGVMAIEGYKNGELVYVDNDFQASGSENNFITWRGIVFDEPVDSVVLFMIEGGDFFNIDNLIIIPQDDNDGDGVPNVCDCAPGDPNIAGSFAERCDDGIDNDCDLLTDEADPDCGGNQASACGQYADETLAAGNGGWLTSGNQSWRYEQGPGFWHGVSTDNIVSVLETSRFQISEGACNEVFKATIDYGGQTELNFDFLETAYSVNGGAYMVIDTQSGNLAPKTYTLPNSIDPGDAINFRFTYTTDSATVGLDPTISRIRIFSDADADNDSVCDACDCAPGNANYGDDCDLDDDGYCGEDVGQLNPAVAECDGDTGVGGTNFGTDCNDDAMTANPGKLVETGLCNDGLDNDCDGPIDADDPDCLVDDCTDNDSDGFGSGTTCLDGPDCDDNSPLCTTDCSDSDADNIPDCRDDCIDEDGDGYGIGPGCTAPDCNDDIASCTTDCTTDADSNGTPDCEQDCIDGDGDGYGVGSGCIAADCDDAAPQCTTDCSDADADGIADCKDTCIDVDMDGFGVGPGCTAPDCNDEIPTCTTDCITDIDGGDGNGIPDCEEVCEDADEDGYGIGPSCIAPDCDDTTTACTTECIDTDNDRMFDCSDDDDDNDGLTDQQEIVNNTNPLDPDSDDDGLLDGQEVNNYGTDPNNPDTDGEGLQDGEEVKEYGTNPNEPDTDFGGVDDKTEVDRGSNAIDNPADDLGGAVKGNGLADCSAGGEGATPWLLAMLFLVLAGLRRRGLGRGVVAAALIATVGVGAIGETAQATGPDGFSVQNFQVKPGNDRIFSVEGTEVAPAWSPYGGLWFHYVDDPLRLVTSVPGQADIEQRLIENVMQLQLGLGIGLFDIAEFEVVVPITLSATGGAGSVFSEAGAGLGDLLARVRLQILGRNDDGDGFGLNFGVGVGIPVGAPEDGGGDGGVTIKPVLAATVGAGRVLIALNAGVNIRTESEDFQNLEFGQELLYGLGAQVDIVDAVAIGAEVFGRTQFNNLFGDSSESPLELAGGFKFRAADALQFDAGAGFGLIGGYGAPDWRIFVGAQYAERAPSDPDTDGDGLVDSIDKCPLQPEDYDNFEDKDGCPDPDNDQDGVLDVNDKCPLDPEDIDGFEDNDGCPDTDNDQDGLPDTGDTCPDDPEDKDGFEDDNGCPDPDNDKDGILDADDGCINEPENINGYQDSDGCPDEPPLARIEGCKIVISEKVYFRTGKATIKKVSYPLLNEVARIVKEHPGIEKVFIEGHTDSRGSARYNRRLSDRRAKAVRKYLGRQGISTRKLTAKGYGEEKPIASNDTPENLELNRRVEFNVKDGKCK
ncbi:MAG: outer membrane protein OmpA-like peptidoglycan-associated protein [Myxococcota bacterium]|jgi:outer membrane protein OmpA-like peptidoglycan-associated protein